MVKVSKQNLSKIAVKNSAYTFTSILFSKIGGLIFTMVIARLLLPELFGIYSLALSIVMIALTFTDLGVGRASVRYVSESLGKGDKAEARSYVRYLAKIKSLFVLFAVFVLILAAKPLALDLFEKPLVLMPLLFSTLYIVAESSQNFIGSLFAAKKYLKPTPIIEIFAQSSKILLSLAAIIYFSNEFKVSGIFVAFFFSSLISFFISILILMKKDKELFFGNSSKIEKPRVLSYMGFMGIASLSLVFFGSIDTIMLGKFVESSYIGYYRASLSLVLAVSGLLSFTGILLPIFTQISGQRLERGFQKTFRYLFIFAIPMLFGLVFLAKFLIFLIYGSEYSSSLNSLYVLSLLILSAPLIDLYSTLFAAKEKAKTLSRYILFALAINIVLNYFLIKNFVAVSQDAAIIGAGLATLISRTSLLFALIVKTKSKIKLDVKFGYIFKPIFSTAVMCLFLFLYNKYLELSLVLGAIEVLFGAAIYFTTLYLIGGVNKQDFNTALYLIPSFVKRK